MFGFCSGSFGNSGPPTEVTDRGDRPNRRHKKPAGQQLHEQQAKASAKKQCDLREANHERSKINADSIES